MKKKSVIISVVITLVLALMIVLTWVNEHNGYKPNKNELVDMSSIVNYLEDNGVDISLTKTSNIGVYIDSFQFDSSNDVELSGYIWQTIYKEDLETETFGIVFPESIGGTTLVERYSSETEQAVTMGWYFETIVRQQFDYSKYPLDHKTVWLRIMPSDFSSEMLFLPDIEAYTSTDYEDSFGISEDIVFTGWNLRETFFDFQNQSYDTTFGLASEHVQNNYPIMSYNIVVERNFVQAIIVNLTLMFVIMALLYSLVLMITTEEGKMLGIFGMSASGAIGTSSALFFSVLLAHIDLRNMFVGQFVYLELFYYIAYLFILGISVLVFIFMKELKNPNHIVVSSNANIFKLVYWPVYFVIIFIFTYIWM